MTKKTILAVDDDESLRDAYDYALTSQYNVVLAIDGFDGLAKYKSLAPDMIFLDLKMPRLDGISVLKMIRDQDSKTPIYIVTSFAKEYMSDLKSARQQGFTFELANKPLTTKQLQAIAKSVLPS